MVISLITPVRILMTIGWREVLLTNCSSRVYSMMTGRPVAMVRCAQISSRYTSCLLPKPPPMRGFTTRMRLIGNPNTGAIIRRTWKGTCVLVRMTRRSSSSQ